MQFLGLVGCRCVLNFSDATSLLTDFTEKEAPDPVEKTEHCKWAFCQVNGETNFVLCT